MLRISYIMVVLASLLSLLAGAFAKADYTGDMRMESGDRTTTGKVFGKKTKQRMDMKNQGQDMSVIVDAKARTAFVLMHANRMAITSNAKDYGADVPRCDHGDAARCFQENGFTKAGTETVDGHPCTVFQKNDKSPHHGKPYTIRVWNPQDLKEVAYLKMEIKEEGSSDAKMRMQITNVQTTSVADNKFTIPSDYRKMDMGSMGAGAGGKGGRPSKEEMMKMIEAQKAKRGH